MIETLIKPVSDIVGKFVKDKDLQAKLDQELSTLFHQANLAQIEVNKIEAKGSPFQRNWRPSVGWICSFALGYHFIIAPILKLLLKLWVSIYKCRI